MTQCQVGNEEAWQVACSDLRWRGIHPDHPDCKRLRSASEKKNQIVSEKEELAPNKELPRGVPRVKFAVMPERAT